MTHTGVISLLIVILLMIPYQGNQAQPLKRIIIRKPPIIERRWGRNKHFPAGGIVLVRDGILQISQTPPTMRHYVGEGYHISLSAVNNALRIISDLIELKETSGLELGEKLVLKDRIQALRNYTDLARDMNARYQAQRMNEAEETLEELHPQGVEISEGKIKDQYVKATSVRRRAEDATTSRHELTKLLLYLIDNEIKITPIIRETISYWKKLLTAYWERFDSQRRRRESQKNAYASAASTKEGQANQITDQPDHAQQPMASENRPIQSQQPMAFGNQPVPSQQPMASENRPIQSQQPMASGNQPV